MPATTANNDPRLAAVLADPRLRRRLERFLAQPAGMAVRIVEGTAGAGIPFAHRVIY